MTPWPVPRGRLEHDRREPQRPRMWVLSRRPDGARPPGNSVLGPSPRHGLIGAILSSPLRVYRPLRPHGTPRGARPLGGTPGHSRGVAPSEIVQLLSTALLLLASETRRCGPRLGAFRLSLLAASSADVRGSRRTSPGCGCSSQHAQPPRPPAREKIYPWSDTSHRSIGAATSVWHARRSRAFSRDA